MSPPHAPAERNRELITDDELRKALGANPLFGGEEGIVEEVLPCVDVLELGLDDMLIGEGRNERDLFLILSGALSVRIDGREIAVRRAGSYVGEMSLIDRTTRRTATVVALDRTVVGRIPEQAFTVLAEEFPVLWRNLAADMVRRFIEQEDDPA